MTLRSGRAEVTQRCPVSRRETHDRVWFVRPSTRASHESLICRNFARNVWDNRIGPRLQSPRLWRQQNPPLCRPFERREHGTRTRDLRRDRLVPLIRRLARYRFIHASLRALTLICASLRRLDLGRLLPLRCPETAGSSRGQASKRALVARVIAIHGEMGILL